MTAAEEQQVSPRPPRFYYGWWMVALACLVTIVATAPLQDAIPIWSAALVDQFEWSGTHLTAAFSITFLLGLAAPAAGYLSDRFGPRRIVVAGLGLVAAGTLFIGLLQDSWPWFAAIFVIATGQFLAGFVPLVALLSNWFVRQRSTAIAVTLASTSLFALFVLPVISWIYDTDGLISGWRITAFALAGIVALVAVLVSSKFHNHPEELGLLPDGDSNAETKEGTGSFTIGQVMQSRTSWILIAAHFLVTAGALTSRTHMAANMIDAGLTFTQLSLALSVHSTVWVVFAIIGGLAGDRFPKQAVLSFSALVLSVGVLAIALADSPPMFYLAVTLTGMGAGGMTPLIWAILPDYFGVASLGKVLGAFAMISGIAGILNAVALAFPFLTGILIPENAIIFLAAGLTLVGALLYRNVHPPEPPRLTTTEQRLP